MKCTSTLVFSNAPITKCNIDRPCLTRYALALLYLCNAGTSECAQVRGHRFQCTPMQQFSRTLRLHSAIQSHTIFFLPTIIIKETLMWIDFIDYRKCLTEDNF